MPKISSAFSSIKISLPSYPDSEIEIKTNITIGEVVEAEKVDSALEKSVLLASKMILKWNFQDEEGNELPVSQEILKQLPATDLEFLLDKITPYLQKKTLSDKTK